MLKCLIFFCLIIFNVNNAESLKSTRSIWSFFIGVSAGKNLPRCDCKCGIPNRSSRFLGGVTLQPHEFPWLGFLSVKGVFPIPATLINDRYVVTAASAVIGLTPYDVKVVLGLHDGCYTDVNSIMMSTSVIFIHPEFSYASHYHDIALIRLSSVVPYSRWVLPICLPTPGASYIGRVSTIASWNLGLVTKGRQLATCEPRKIGLPILEPEYCAHQTATILDSQGCVGVSGSTNILSKKDAGAGVLYRTYQGYYELVGVLSDNIRNGNYTENTPATINNDHLSIYTKIGKHLSWLLKHSRDGCYCNKL